MNLYRFEITIDGQLLHAVVAAEDDETAFHLVDVELEKQFLKIADVQNVSLYERKKIHKGAGFVLSTFETVL